MVDITKSLGCYLTVEMAKTSTTKKIVIIGEGEYRSQNYNGEVKDVLFIPVELERLQLDWRPNRDTIRNLMMVWGKDTRNWIGKIVHLRISIIRGKEAILGEAILQ